MHVIYTFAEAELVKAVSKIINFNNRLRTKSGQLAFLYKLLNML